jgi:cytidyltransferase-like protein
MVADLFHYGHAEFLRQISTYKKPGDQLYIGIHSDKTVESYKRTPIMTMDERIKIVSTCKYVDCIIPDAPLNISMDYVAKHKIDTIFIPDNRTEEEIKLMVEIPYSLGIVKKIPYTHTISTTDIIARIKARQDL